MKFRKNAILILGAAVIVGAMFAGKIVEFYFDLLWFRTQGLESALWTIVGSQLGFGALAGGSFFLLTYGFLGSAYRKTQHLPIALAEEFRRDMPFLDLIASNLKPLVFAVPLVLSLMAGLVAGQRWDIFLKFLNRVPFRQADPIFGLDYSFYLFTLPLLSMAKNILVEGLAVSAVGTGVVFFFKRSFYLGPRGPQLTPEARRTLSLLAGFASALLAFNFYLDRYQLMTNGSGVVSGIGYADYHGRLPLLGLLVILSLLAAVVCFVNMFQQGLRKLALAGTVLGIAYLGGNFYPALLKKFVVDPNELVKETPFIEHTIAGTRLAYGLSNIETNVLTGAASLASESIRKNAVTIENVRLWDQEPLLDTLGQIQEIRTYYQFASVDNDRYTIDGTYRQTLLSPRELLSSSLPNRTWINEHLTFTHGYGVSLSPVNMVTPEGLPVLFIKDIPPRSVADLKVTRPEIYFGEIARDYVFVDTGTKEFDYPEGEKNVYKNYEGTGGIPVGSFLRKVLMAVRFKTLKILFSEDIGYKSRVLMYRNITEMAGKAAPFLQLDRDPYLVISKEGRLFWLYDAYTTSSNFPYSHKLSIQGFGNYVRNSVKIAIDAYQGTMNFYVADPDDPVLLTYRAIFPGLFKDMKEMPADLRKHIRYPSDLFSIQTFIYATYHMTTPQVFYNKEDQWEIPQIDNRPMQPYYTIMKLPNKEHEEYILMLPFAPRGKSNLSAWMVARSDDEHYGTMAVYTFPKQKLIYGPNQIVARINQDAEISRMISLWDQRGSQVIQGNLLVIPIEESLIYVRPLYLKADAGKIPELKRVIVGYEDQIAMEPTLEEALEKIFGGLHLPSRRERLDAAAERPSPAEAEVPAKGGVTLSPSDYRKIKEYFQRAAKSQEELDKALAGYRKELQSLGEVLEGAAAQPENQPGGKSIK